MINIKAFLGLSYYTSSLDQFLLDFDESYAKLSASQQKEKAKYARVYQLRDNPIPPASQEDFWEKF